MFSYTYAKMFQYNAEVMCYVSSQFEEEESDKLLETPAHSSST